MQMRQDKGYPARTEHLPIDWDDVNSEWLTRALQCEYPDVVVTEMRLVQLIPGHTTKARFELTLNPAGIDAGIPRQVCLKANWTGDPLSSRVCANEARFYKQLRGKMDVPAPNCFFADWDDDSDGQQGFIVLEDLAPLGGTFGTSARAIDIEDIAKSLSGLAALHGTSWNHPELYRHGWLETAMAPQTATDDYWGMMEEIAAAANKVPERLAVFPDWMAKDPNRLRSAFRQLCAQESADTSPLCLVHGDAHLGNSYRKTNGERMWFDWQIVRKGRPWRDYTYFVIGSMTIEDRRKAERDLLRHYCEELVKHGVHITLDKAWDDYRRWVVWGLVAWQLNINPNEETMPPLERFCRAADDLETHKFFEARF
jgi:hypothetical protein